MKVCIGNNDVASIISDLKVVFAEYGVETITIMDRKTTVLDRCEVEYDFTTYKKMWFGGVRPRRFQKWLQELQHIEYKVWRKAIKECDIFIFIWSSFKKDYSDIIELKKLGKKVIFLFCGDDVRWYYAAKQEYEMYGFKTIEYDEDYNYGISGLEKQLLRLRTAEKHADFIFSRLDQAQLQLRPHFRYHMWVDSNIVKYNPEQRKINPIIVHAPSHRKLKGTQFVLEAFEKLKSEGIEFTPLLIENIPNRKALAIYTNADIVIDQLIITGTGKLASEALAAGCVVMAHMGYTNYPQKNAQDCPVIDVNAHTIYSELKKIILDYPRRVELAAKGRDYVVNNVDVRIFCKKILNLCKGDEIEYDYYPDFYRNKFTPESVDKLPIYNKWNFYVKECDWYKDYVLPGERSGLLF